MRMYVILTQRYKGSQNKIYLFIKFILKWKHLRVKYDTALK